MGLLGLAFLLLSSNALLDGVDGAIDNVRAQEAKQEALGFGVDGESYRTACPDYRHYSFIPQYVSCSRFFEQVY